MQKDDVQAKKKELQAAIDIEKAKAATIEAQLRMNRKKIEILEARERQLLGLPSRPRERRLRLVASNGETLD